MKYKHLLIFLVIFSFSINHSLANGSSGQGGFITNASRISPDIRMDNNVFDNGFMFDSLVVSNKFIQDKGFEVKFDSTNHMMSDTYLKALVASENQLPMQAVWNAMASSQKFAHAGIQERAWEAASAGLIANMPYFKNKPKYTKKIDWGDLQAAFNGGVNKAEAETSMPVKWWGNNANHVSAMKMALDLIEAEGLGASAAKSNALLPSKKALANEVILEAMAAAKNKAHYQKLEDIHLDVNSNNKMKIIVNETEDERIKINFIN